MMDLEEHRIYKGARIMNSSANCGECIHKALEVELYSNPSSCFVIVHIHAHTSPAANLTF